MATSILSSEDAKVKWAYIDVPLTAFTKSDATVLAKFSAGANAIGYAWVDSKAFVIRWNTAATPGAIAARVSLPPDFDYTGGVQVSCVCSKSGATVGDATTLGVAAYFTAVGALHDAASDVGGTTGALTGNAAAKTTAELTVDIAPGTTQPALLNLVITPTAGLLGTDDLYLHRVRIKYLRKAQTLMGT